MYIYCSNFQHASFFDIGSFVSERDVLNSPNVSSRYISDYFEGYKYRPSVNICVTGILVYGTNFNNKNDYIKPKRLTIKSLSILTTTEIRSSDNKLEIYSAGFNFNLYSFGSSSYSLGRYAQFIKLVPSKFGNKEKNKVERSIGM